MAKGQNGKSTETAIVKAVPIEEYNIVASRDQILEIIETNMGAGGMGPADLTKIKIPGGGGTQWEEETIEGVKHVDEITGVVVYWEDVRLYWKVPYDESTERTPPDCKTVGDCLVGVGDPGGVCRSCPKDAWPGKVGGIQPAKLCSERRVLFICRADDWMPIAMPLPVMSRAKCHEFFIKLTQGKLTHYGAIINFTLTRTENASGKPYSFLTMKVVDRLSEPQTAKMRDVRLQMKKSFAGVAEEVAGPQEAE